MTDNSASADSLGNFGSGGGIENDGSLTVTDSHLHEQPCLRRQRSPTPSPKVLPEEPSTVRGLRSTVTGGAFTNNQAVGPSTGTGEGNGGAINNSSTASITNSMFNGNRALGRLTNGGAISTGENELTNPATDPLAISHSSFTGNEAVGANGPNNSTELFGGEALGGAIANACPADDHREHVYRQPGQGRQPGRQRRTALTPTPSSVRPTAAAWSTSLARSPSPTRPSAATRPSVVTPPSALAGRRRAAASLRKSSAVDDASPT